MHSRIVAGWVDDFALAYDIIDKDQCSRPGKLYCPRQIPWNIRLVSIDKDEIEWAFAFARKFRQRIQRGAQTQRDKMIQTGSCNVTARYIRVLRVRFESYQAAAVGKCPGQPYRAVSAQRANLKNPVCPRGPGEQMEQLSLVWRNINRRQSSGGICGQGFIKRRIGRDELIDNVPVNRFPSLCVFSHSFNLSGDVIYCGGFGAK